MCKCREEIVRSFLKTCPTFYGRDLGSLEIQFTETVDEQRVEFLVPVYLSTTPFNLWEDVQPFRIVVGENWSGFTERSED